MSIEENGYTNGENGEGASREDSTAEHSFDELARGVGTGTVSRGKALRVLVASLLGGAFVATAGAAGAAPKPGGTGCPKPGQVRDPANKGKCICASGLTTCVNGSCIDPNTCGGGQTVNTTSCQCECASGKVFCGGRCITDPGCGTDQILVADANGNCSCQCRNESKAIDPTSGECVCANTCTNPEQTPNPTTCACECPSGEVACGNACVSNTCPQPDQFFDPSTCTCACKNENKEIDPISGQCECRSDITCAITGQEPNPTTCACECPTGEVACGGVCIPEPSCGTGQFFNTTTCTCECRNENQEINPISGECECNNTCINPDQTPNPNTCACECPTGEVACGGVCIPEPSCGTGQFFNTTTCTCECRNENKVIVPDPNDPTTTTCECPADPTCDLTKGFVVDQNTCQCVCPNGTAECTGECVSTTCPAGQTFSDCQCVPTCAAANCTGCCQDGVCQQGTTAEACGSGGGTCVSCTTNVANAQPVCNANRTCGFACNSGFTLINGACVATCPAGRCSGGPSPVNCAAVSGCVCVGTGASSTCQRM